MFNGLMFSTLNWVEVSLSLPLLEIQLNLLNNQGCTSGPCAQKMRGRKFKPPLLRKRHARTGRKREGLQALTSQGRICVFANKCFKMCLHRSHTHTRCNTATYVAEHENIGKGMRCSHPIPYFITFNNSYIHRTALAEFEYGSTNMSMTAGNAARCPQQHDTRVPLCAHMCVYVPLYVSVCPFTTQPPYFPMYPCLTYK